MPSATDLGPPARPRDEIGQIINGLAPPTAPLAVPQSTQRRGLKLLDTGMKLEHADRVIERLEIHDRSYISRSVTVDLDINKIASDTLAALTIQNSPDASTHGYWIPVSRHSRHELAPTSVHGPDGAIFSRLPYRNSVELVSAGVLYILRMLIDSAIEAASDSDALSEALRSGDRARWCLERAIVEYVYLGGSFGYRELADESRSREPNVFGTDPALANLVQGTRQRIKPPYDSASVRKSAVALMDCLFPDDRDAFWDLLDSSAHYYLLTIAVPRGVLRTSASYSASILRSEAPAGRRQTRFLTHVAKNLSSLLPIGRTYRINYETEIPSHVNAFHLEASTDPDIRVRDFILTTDEDNSEIKRIRKGLQSVATGLHGSLGTHVDKHDTYALADGKIAEHELQALLSRLRIVVRSRLRESANFAMRYGHILGSRKAPPVPSTNPFSRLLVIAKLNADGDLPNLRLTPGLDSATAIKDFDRSLGDLQLEQAVAVDSDPRDNIGNLGWVRKSWPLPVASGGSFPVKASASIVLIDDRPALVESVRWMTLALTAIIYLMGILATQNPGWVLTKSAYSLESLEFSQADAVATVLLLVPGLLLARLHLPAPQTVMGSLRALATRSAYMATSITTILACWIAVHSGIPELVLTIAFAALTCLVTMIQLDIRTRDSRNDDRSKALPPLPTWMRLLHRLDSGRKPDDVVYSVQRAAFQNTELRG